MYEASNHVIKVKLTFVYTYLPHVGSWACA